MYPVNEDWHYVGDTDEPAFATGWSNVSSSFPALAFRLREAGVVDIVGAVTTNGTGSALFTLPVGYRPASSTMAIVPYIRQRSAVKSGQLLTITDAGIVTPTDGGVASDINYIGGSYFLIPPDNA